MRARWRGYGVDGALLAHIAIDAVVSLVVGRLAARRLRVSASPESGRAMAQWSWTYFPSWLGAFVIQALVAVTLGETTARVNAVEILSPVFLLVASRNAYLYWRAGRLGPALPCPLKVR